MESDIKESPINSTPKPTRISPTCFFFPLPVKRLKTAPTPTSAGFIISPHSLMDTIQLVTVVPILAPIIIPTACCRLMIPAFTKPTTMTVVAELLWMMAVIPVPKSTPMSRLLVKIPKSCCILCPADFCSPSAIASIP